MFLTAEGQGYDVSYRFPSSRPLVDYAAGLIGRGQGCASNWKFGVYRIRQNVEDIGTNVYGLYVFAYPTNFLIRQFAFRPNQYRIYYIEPVESEDSS